MSSRSHGLLSSLQSSIDPIVRLLSPFSSPLLPGPLRRFYQSIYRTLFRSSDLLLGIALGAAFSAATGALGVYARGQYKRRMVRRWEEEDAGKPIEVRSGEAVDGVTGLIGNTPLVRIESLSRLTGCEILGKCEVSYCLLSFCARRCRSPGCTSCTFDQAATDMQRTRFSCRKVPQSRRKRQGPSHPAKSVSRLASLGSMQRR